MAQWGREPEAKPDDLNLKLRTYIGGETQLSQVVI